MTAFWWINSFQEIDFPSAVHNPNLHGYDTLPYDRQVASPTTSDCQANNQFDFEPHPAYAHSLEGMWTDSFYGGSIYVTERRNAVYGVISETEYFVGTRDGDTISGTWYAPATAVLEEVAVVSGSNHIDLMSSNSGSNGNGMSIQHVDANTHVFPSYGDFTITLAADGNSFTGTWNYHGVTHTNAWTETRTSSAAVTNEQAWFSQVFSVFSLAGKWSMTGGDTKTSICIGMNGTYSTSYLQSDPTVVGWSNGTCLWNGQLCHGEWVEKHSDNTIQSGIELYILTAPDTLVNTWWVGLMDDVEYSDHTKANLHSVDWYTMTGTTTTTACAVNSELYENPYAPEPEAPTQIGGAAHAVASLFVMAALMAIVL